ncbi:hypothetical protein NB537_14370 [Vibrio parahaemolyticus]|nr:hypothetical protein [Vibrio parahaemolyticus]MCR9655967.1 hypothetical protein [Vibrio parahaemolyticus]
MHISPKESIKQLQSDSNYTNGRLDALSFMARVVLDSLKVQDKAAYLELKTACLAYSQQHLICLAEIGEEDIEEQAQAFAEEIDNLFCDEGDLFEE